MSERSATDVGDGPAPEEARPQAPGAEAERPQDIPRRGWLQILKRSWAQTTEDQIPLIGAGVAFFGFLALFPSLIALP